MKSEVSTVGLGVAKDEIVEAKVVEVEVEPKKPIKNEEVLLAQPQPQAGFSTSVEPLAPTPLSPSDIVNNQVINL